MSVEFKESREGSVYSVDSYENGRHVGTAKAISDGQEWSKITEVNVEPEYAVGSLKKELLVHLKNELSGQHIFATVDDTDELGIYEELGFFRSKTSFTYVNEVSPAKLDDWEKHGFFLPEGFRFEDEFYPRKSFIDNGNVVKKENVGGIRYRDSLEGADLARINEVLSKAFGGHERDIKKTEEVFRNSQKVEVAYDGDKIVGVARAVTDGHGEALILNVAVDPEYQGFHIGWNVVANLSKQLPGFFIFLNTHPGAVGFYNRKGFKRNKTSLSYSPGEMPQEIAIGFNLPKGYRFPDEY
ncbi:MAG: GNAT family N-acetyltransferase [Lachnospiraceae bacterium]|nr:GNAT family N-acetyltransferase [Lachnospiraceae bacterium]